MTEVTTSIDEVAALCLNYPRRKFRTNLDWYLFDIITFFQKGKCFAQVSTTREQKLWCTSDTSRLYFLLCLRPMKPQNWLFWGRMCQWGWSHGLRAWAQQSECPHFKLSLIVPSLVTVWAYFFFTVSVKISLPRRFFLSHFWSYFLSH